MTAARRSQVGGDVGRTVEQPDPGRPATAPPGMVPDIRTLAPRVLIAGILPFVVYAVIRPHVGSDAVGLIIVSVFPLGDVLIERVRRGRFEPIGILALVGITLGVIGALAFGGNDTLLKLRESTFTGIFGLVCLLSLLRPRPVMYFMGRAFSTDGEPEKVAEFDLIWHLPGVPRRFRVVTVVWGAGLVVETLLRTVLAFGVSTQTFLGVSHVIGWVIIGGLLAWTTVYSRRGEQAVLAEVEAAEAAGAGLATVPDQAGPVAGLEA